MPKNPHAVQLGKLGARKGGLSKWAKMSEADRLAHLAKMRAGRKSKTSPPSCAGKDDALAS